MLSVCITQKTCVNVCTRTYVHTRGNRILQVCCMHHICHSKPYMNSILFYACLWITYGYALHMPCTGRGNRLLQVRQRPGHGSLCTLVQVHYISIDIHKYTVYINIHQHTYMYIYICLCVNIRMSTCKYMYILCVCLCTYIYSVRGNISRVLKYV